jgi:F-type H+-transporting ATPase subunit epsilon
LAEKEFDVKIITPDRIFYEGNASMVEFTTTEGDIGVYPEHIPLTVIIAPGVLTIHEDGGLKQAAIHSGFAEIRGDRVTFLAETAEWPDEIDVNRAKRAEERARERLQSHQANIDVLRAELALKRALTRQALINSK